MSSTKATIVLKLHVDISQIEKVVSRIKELEDSLRCPSKKNGGRCELGTGHEGRHQVGNYSWPDPPQDAPRFSGLFIDRTDGHQVRVVDNDHATGESVVLPMGAKTLDEAYRVDWSEFGPEKRYRPYSH